jgi:hypothetical protein
MQSFGDKNARTAYAFFPALLIVFACVSARAQTPYERGVTEAIDVMLSSALSVCKSTEQNDSQDKWFAYYSDLLGVTNRSRRAFLSLPEVTQNKRVNELIYFHFGSCEKLIEDVRVKGLSEVRSDYVAKRLLELKEQNRR